MVKGTVMPVERLGALQTLICAAVVRPVESCPFTKPSGGLSQLHSATAAAIA